MNGGKLVMWPGTAIVGDLPLTLFDVTNPGLAAELSKLFFSNN